MRRCSITPERRSLCGKSGAQMDPMAQSHRGYPATRGNWILFKKTGFGEIILIYKITFLKIASEAYCTVLPESKLSCSPVALRHFTHLIESCKQDSLHINITLPLHCTEFSLLDYSIFQQTTDYNMARVLFLKQLCLNILVLQFNFPSESTAVIFYQQIHSRMFLLATVTKTFFHLKWRLGRDIISSLAWLETFASS